MEKEDRSVVEVSPRQTLLLDRGWLFHLGDIESPVPNTHLASYMANKAGYARGAARPAFDDSDWRELDLPHDWAVEQPFSQDAYLSGGFRPRGVAWYRRHFRLEDADRGRRLTLRFDGVATHCTVYVNGHVLHRNWCGYTGFTIDITDVASYGDELNVIAVRVDATYVEGWWYEGAGIYRHVWLEKTHSMHLLADELFCAPIRCPDGNWDLHTSTRTVASYPTDQPIELVHTLVSPGGQVVEERRYAESLVDGRLDHHAVIEDLKSPELWSLETPSLYRLNTRLIVEGVVVDDVSTPIGFRTICFDSDEGFFLNSRRVRLQGTCNHQDHAGVGVAVPDSIWDFRIKRLKEMGCNAYRCAHNPPAREFLDACDRLGMLVMDETRNFGSSPEHLAQLEAMVRRDRNHPSVILWSICNEEAIQGTATGAAIARTMAAKVREELDATRPVTASVSGGLLGEHCIADAVNVIGINYQLPIHDEVHKKYPRAALVAGETHCVCATRGEYRKVDEKFILPADDSYAAPWGASGRATWRALRDKPYVGGIFIWTGFDYRGEPTPHGWPCINSFFGLVDTCGFPKDGFHLYRAYWTADPFIHLLPHWNAPTTRLIAYSNCDEVELWLNGRSLGRKKVDSIDMAEWPVTYEAGEVRAVAYRDGKEVATAQLATTGPAVALGLETGDELSGDGETAVAVTVFAVDAAGRRVPTAKPLAVFSVDGPAKVLGVGNGDPTCHEPDKASQRSLFNGLAQVILQSTGTAGEVRLTAAADGLKPATLTLTAKPAVARPTVPVARRRWLITDWRVSPRQATPPDIAGAAGHDMNTWERIKLTAAHQAIPAGESGFVVYQGRLKLPKRLQSAGGRLVLHGVVGEAELFIAGQPVLQSAERTISVPLPAVAAEGADVAIRLRASRQGAGLSGYVELSESSGG